MSYPPQQNQYYQPMPPRKTNGLAIAGFVLSLLGCTSLIGLILSIIGLSQINKDPNQEGKGLAIAGIVIGALCVIGGILWWLFVVALASDPYYYY